MATAPVRRTRARLAAEPAPASRRQARLGRWFRAWLGFRRNPLAMSGLGIVLLLVLMAVFAPLIVDQQSATLQVLADRLQPASWQHPFGTDELGRDIFARVVFGSRITLTIVVMVGVIVVPVGLAIGLPAGYFGGVVDTVLMRITDIFLAFPRLVLALAFAAALGPGNRERRDRHRAHRLATLCPPRPRRDVDQPARRIHPGRGAARRLAPAHHRHPDRAALPAQRDRPPDAWTWPASS